MQIFIRIAPEVVDIVSSLWLYIQKIIIFRDVASCSLVDLYQLCFSLTYRSTFFQYIGNCHTRLHGSISEDNLHSHRRENLITCRNATRSHVCRNWTQAAAGLRFECVSENLIVKSNYRIDLHVIHEDTFQNLGKNVYQIVSVLYINSVKNQ
jgi:hypothetical protein